MMLPTRSRWLTVTGLATLFTLCAPGVAESAHADITIVSDVTTVGQVPAPPTGPPPPANTGTGDTSASPAPTPPPPSGDASGPQGPATRHVIVRYKGHKARTEYTTESSGSGISSSKVLIYDEDADKLYTLDPAVKTYTIRSLKDVREKGSGSMPGMPNGGAIPSRMADRMKINASADLKSDKDAEKLTIAEKSAVRSTLSGSMKIEIERPSFGSGGGGGRMGGGFPGGGRRGGGGFPGGGGGFPGGGGGGYPGGGGGGYPGGGGGRTGGGRMPEMPSTEISGSLLLTQGITLPDNGKLSALPSVMIVLGDTGGAFFKPLLSRLQKQKVFPLGGDVTLETNPPSSDTPTRLTVRTEVKSVSEEALSDDLFAPPADYKEVELPTPTMPRRQE